MSLSIEDFFDIKVFDDGGKVPMSSRCEQIQWLVKKASNFGMFMEFGVYRGTTIKKAAVARPDVEFYGFDSFEGLPEKWNLGGKVIDEEKFNLSGRLPEVPDNVNLVKGYFSDTLPTFIEEKMEDKEISYLHIDSDLYSSAKFVLSELDEYILPGTIILFDELAEWRLILDQPYDRIPHTKYTTWEDHEWKALNEWLDECDRKVMPVSRNWSQSAAVIVTQ